MGSTSSKKPSKKQRGLKWSFAHARERIWAKKRKFWAGHVKLHRTFHRSYYEDYHRPLEIPGLMSHAATAFKIIFRNWRLFVPMILWIAALDVILVGLMSEETYVQLQDSLEDNAEAQGQPLGMAAKTLLLLVSTVTTAGLNSSMSEVQQVFVMLIFLIVWLVTIYLVRHRLAGHRIRLRDGFYNALTPMISTLIVVLVILTELIPIMIAIVGYSTAVQTDFLSTPFYALVFYACAGALFLLSAYLVATSFLALFAVSVPGMYPMKALRSASDLVAGRRIKLLIRLIYLFLVLAFLVAVVMVPLIFLDLWLKGQFEVLEGIPFVAFGLIIMAIFSLIYATVYCYLFYRRVLDYDDEWAKIGHAPKNEEEWETMETRKRSV